MGVNVNVIKDDALLAFNDWLETSAYSPDEDYSYIMDMIAEVYSKEFKTLYICGRIA